jgi:archaellum biogenesis ATPase FlaH
MVKLCWHFKRQIAKWEFQMSKPNLDPEYLEQLKREHDKIQLYSGLGFLKEHRGLRRGKIHLLIGNTSTGKSSVTRLLIEDFVQQNNGKKIVVWMSEENREDFEIGMINTKINIRENELVCLSEHDKVNCKKERIFAEIADSDFFIFDNLTTSYLYGQKPEAQSSFAMELKAEVSKANTAALIVAHTNNIMEGAGRLIDLTDIRGAKTIVNIAEYAYVLQMFTIGNTRFQTLRILKSRGFSIENANFMLGYDTKNKRYVGDAELPFLKIKEFNNARNKL